MPASRWSSSTTARATPRAPSPRPPAAWCDASRSRRSGPGAARNAGVAARSGRILAFTDADCYPAPNWLAAGVAALESADLVQGAVRPRPDQPVGPFDRTLWVGAHDGLWQTANLFTTRELFDRVGGFEDWLHPRHGKILGEDVWFGWQIRRTGARSAFAPEVRVEHEVFPRSARELRRGAAATRALPRADAQGSRAARDHVLGAGLPQPPHRAVRPRRGGRGARRWARRSPLPLLAAAPYARTVAERALRVRPPPSAGGRRDGHRRRRGRAHRPGARQRQRAHAAALTARAKNGSENQAIQGSREPAVLRTTATDDAGCAGLQEPPLRRPTASRGA